MAERPAKPLPALANVADFRYIFFRMRLGTLVGIILIVLGVVGLAAGGFSFTHKEKVIDLGPIEATADKKESVAIPPCVGTIALVAGVALVAATSRRRS